jgi:hypothetical protein
MSTEISIKDKLLKLREWMPSILESIKKDLRQEHLKNDVAFAKKYFAGKNVHKASNQELADAYMCALNEENGKEIAEFIAHRWIFKNSEMYQYFEEHLSVINPNFSEIKELSEQDENGLITKAVGEFGPLRTYLFSEINCVAFSENALRKLQEQSRQDCARKETQLREETERRSYDELIFAHNQEIARLTDKYEKKLSGLQKKCIHDVEFLKKQVAQLQRKLAGV